MAASLSPDEKLAETVLFQSHWFTLDQIERSSDSASDSDYASVASVNQPLLAINWYYKV